MTQTTTLPDLLDRLAELARSDRRQLVALVGPPGAGKSHVSDALAAGLAERVPGRAAILTMDGYHLDDGLLTARGDLARKGAPHTFDLDGFSVMLDRLAADDGRPVLVPVFDRALEISRAGARQIDAAARLIVVEGNYLLLDRPGWRDLSRHFVLTVFLQVPHQILRDRLLARWKDLPPEVALTKVEANDLPNMRLVCAESRPADLVLDNV
ncbi:nucleoside/nucleotide kinase family protein [Paracoccus sediminilitoris]|uniref:nucleoside/nucleotide kinase family protein n=1 Tax=Paracoccus sediminilitoris TaxID=2202419 RepID=UPI00272A550A|nr:nucleoside/nucleotide kinase family protein [Paracoccus sediminilitoris]